MTAALHGDLQLGGKTYRLQFALIAFQSLAELWGKGDIDAVVAEINKIKGTLTAGRKLADVIWAGTRRFPPDPDVTPDQLFIALEDDGLGKFPETMQRTFEILMAQYPQDRAQKKTEVKKAKQRFRR